MPSDDSKSTRDYFSSGASLKEFNRSFAEHLAKIQKETVSRFVNPRNTHRLRHGGQWSHPGASQVEDASIRQHSAFAETPFKDIVGHDLTIIARNIQALVSQLERQFAEMVYSTVSAAADRVGNVVDTKAEGSVENALIAMMEKIEFSADKNGNVSMPEMHVGPEAFNRIRPLMTQDNPAFNEKFGKIKERKIAEAIAKEQDRKKKFLRYGE
ncbi:MAG: hypothetical protein V4454_01430 [Pseudomonadota bacterium]